MSWEQCAILIHHWVYNAQKGLKAHELDSAGVHFIELNSKGAWEQEPSREEKKLDLKKNKKLNKISVLSDLKSSLQSWGACKWKGIISMGHTSICL